MLTLNQKLPGEYKERKKKTVIRSYRPGEAPIWIKKKKIDENISFNYDKFSQFNKQNRNKESLNFDISNLKIPKKSTIKQKIDYEKINEDRIVQNIKRKICEPKLIKNFDYKNLSAPTIPSNVKVTEPKNKNRLNLKKNLLSSQKLLPQKQKKSSQEIVSLEKKLSESDVDEGENMSSSSSESSSEDVEEYVSVMQRRFISSKPKFIRKTKRETLSDPKIQSSLMIQDKTEMELKEIKEKKRKESVNLVIDIVRNEERRKREEKESKKEKMPDDDDDIDEEKQFESWKLREIKRLKRDEEERTMREKEKKEVMKRRNMTDFERDVDNSKYSNERFIKNDNAIKFLQKYYHKGAYYQDEDLIPKEKMKRNFLKPVGEDKYTDRTMLPKVMQVKNFGLAGRTKYTHLVDQDTTFGDQNKTPYMTMGQKKSNNLATTEELNFMENFNSHVNPWNDYKSAINKYTYRKVGYNGFQRPSKRKTR